MREEAERRIGHLYPHATLPDGRKATVIAWIWARTVTCPNPACRATMPLVRSFWLGKKKSKEAWVRPIIEGSSVRFAIGHGRTGPPIEGTVSRTGATCLVCTTPVPLAHIRTEGKAGRLGAQLMAIVAEGNRERIYLPPDPTHESAATVSRPNNVPDAEVTTPSHDVDRLPMYGMTRWADAFTIRQLTALCTLSDLVGVAREQLIEMGSTLAYADAVATYLAFLVGKLADRNSAVCTWDSSPSKETPRSTFARQAIPMNWDFAEGNPFAKASGNFGDAVGFEMEAIERLPADGTGSALQADVTSQVHSNAALIATDPPYYDNVGYADLSDFFYVWLRRSLAGIYPDLFSTMLTPKSGELVASPYRFGGDRAKAKHFFEHGFEQAFLNLRRVADPDYPLTVFYAFKQSERDEGGIASTGWETMLAALLRSGFVVTATWPMRTELGNRMLSSGTNALASSVVLACRPRSETAGITDRRGFLAALHAELPQALRELQQGNIAPVDLAQAAIGPGMAVFSRYAKVVEPTGEPMPVRSALALINQVLDEVLAEQEGEFDADTRFAIKWFEQYGFDEAGYDPAEGLARAMNVSVKGLQDAGILVARAGRVRLLRRSELAPDWDPATDTRMPVWEVTQQLVRALWDEGSEARAGELVHRLGGVGEVARDLAYRLYSICERRAWADDALGFNALVTAWPEIARRAASAAPVQQELA
jgi:putative DNA methylase